MSIANTGGLLSSSVGGVTQKLTCASGTFSNGSSTQSFVCNTTNGQWNPSPATTVCGSGSGIERLVCYRQ